LFAGILKCADCGSPLAYMRRKLKDSEKGVYRCSRYNNNGGKACSPHYIDEADISAFVLNDIKLHARLAADERKQLADRLIESVTVSERAKVYGRKTQELTIEYRFIGNLPADAKEDIA